MRQRGTALNFPPELPIPPEVLRIAEKLEGAGFETWCVGGAVRDTLLGQDNKDFDLATAARPEDVRKIFRRTIPVGIEHGTVAVLDKNNQPHEVTAFRRDVKTDGRHAVVEFGVALDDDLARRDFTINAIAYHPLRHEWRDPFCGAKDLEDGLIRAVGTAWHRFREDYLRILRALRFATRFGFEIEPATWKAAKACVAGLQHLSAERVRGEWMRGIEGAVKPSEFVALWEKVGALGVWLEEVEEEGGGRRTFLRIDGFRVRDSVLLTSYLSADPATTLTRLKCSRREIERARLLGRHRASPPDPSSASAVRRWMAEVGDVADDLCEFARVDGEGDSLAEAVNAVRDSGAPLTVGELSITGSDLIRAGVAEGPLVGEVLNRLLDDVLENPGLNVKEGLLLRAQLFLEESPPPSSLGGQGSGRALP